MPIVNAFSIMTEMVRMHAVNESAQINYLYQNKLKQGQDPLEKEASLEVAKTGGARPIPCAQISHGRGMHEKSPYFSL
jgi:hypothetical protein